MTLSRQAIAPPVCHIAAVAGDATHRPVGLPSYWPVTLTSARA